MKWLLSPSKQVIERDTRPACAQAQRRASHPASPLVLCPSHPRSARFSAGAGSA